MDKLGLSYEKLKKQYDGQSINNTRLRFLEIDGEKDEKDMENFENNKTK